MRKGRYLFLACVGVGFGIGLMLDKSLTPYVLALLLGSTGFTMLLMWWFEE